MDNGWTIKKGKISKHQSKIKTLLKEPFYLNIIEQLNKKKYQTKLENKRDHKLFDWSRWQTSYKIKKSYNTWNRIYDILNKNNINKLDEDEIDWQSPSLEICFWKLGSITVISLLLMFILIIYIGNFWEDSKDYVIF